jgi:hypothetical protein
MAGRINWYMARPWAGLIVDRAGAAASAAAASMASISGANGMIFPQVPQIWVLCFVVL